MSEKKDREFLTLYQITIDDIRDAKHQQWRIIQLTLLAIAAIVAIPRIKCVDEPLLDSLRFLVKSVGIIGMVLVASFAYSLSRYRKKKRIIRRRFENVVRLTDKTPRFESKFLRWTERKIIREFQQTWVFALIFIWLIWCAINVALEIIPLPY